MTYRQDRLSRDLIHCDVRQKADTRLHDGALPHVRGACCYQVVRASQDKGIAPEGLGHTYNHAPMLAYYRGHFLYEYLSSPRGEHEAPSLVLLSMSRDGIHWGKPQVAFPPLSVCSSCYIGPGREHIRESQIPCIVHHRMGFYLANNGCLLITTFYGISPDFHMAPNNGYGVGRVVREVLPDLSLSDIYFLRYNQPGGYSETTVKRFAHFEQSDSEQFKEACRDLLSNQLVTSQWWEEQRFDSLLEHAPNGKALAYYHLPDGRIMGVFKDSLVSISCDGGQSWSRPCPSASIETSTGKVWGQRTTNAQYALVYNPSPDAAHRWPLAMVSGHDGIHFSNLSAIVPEISPSRYEGQLKNLGAQYVRGICEHNGFPDDQAMWLAYSVNKEDMWIARVPTPHVNEQLIDVHEDMSIIDEDILRNRWNLYVPAWNGAKLVSDGNGRQVLRLVDTDPYDRTRAMRLVRPGELQRVRVVMTVQSLEFQTAVVHVQDRRGQNLCMILFKPDGTLCLRDRGSDVFLSSWVRAEPLDINILCDCVENRLKIRVYDASGMRSFGSQTLASAEVVDRVLIATKHALPWQGLEASGKLGDLGNLPGADTPHAPTVLDIHLVESERLVSMEADSFSVLE